MIQLKYQVDCWSGKAFICSNNRTGFVIHIMSVIANSILWFRILLPGVATVFVLVIVLVFFVGCSSGPDVIEKTTIVADGSTNVYVVNHGWHTGFVIPAKSILKELPGLSERFSKNNYIEFGWGDKGFYQSKEITTGVTFRAIFWPTESVMHVVEVPASPHEYFSASEARKICLTEKQYARLLDFIVHSFYVVKGEIVKLKKGIYGNSQFYQGKGDYYLMNTCNKWTAKGLKSAGFDISTAFKLTSSSIMNYLDQNETELNSCGDGAD